ncbi:MAG TPA: GIY-YIG nuclease family protein [Patescibacteria group bacterium]|nr:GIY-YIG nuclease family protein [Patescibacteria group bacterium]
MYYVYLLENETKDFHYTGLTHDLDRRMVEHEQGLTPMTKGRLLHLKWHCVFPTKEAAARFEKYLKTGSGRAFAKRHLL